MPELPEVESVVRILKTSIIGSTIKETTVQRSKMVSGSGNSRNHLPDQSQNFTKFCNNRTIVNINRRAKNILIEFETGLLLVHFKMTGQLIFTNDKPDLKTEKHIHILWKLNNGWLYYKDIRQFGYVLAYNYIDELIQHFAPLGYEPFEKEFTLTNFATKLITKKSPLKKVFLDQTVVVGLGNIYSDEVCHYAKVLPMRLCNNLTNKETELLYQGIREILTLAIESGGTTKYTHTLPDGSQGKYVNFLQVYGRAGEQCYRCNHILQSTKIAGRTTVYCPNCQH
jgi:formamidopyrimidine-DNA glycosylase